jgi:serine/threonine protein kinase
LQYNPFKSDIYSLGVVFCQILGISETIMTECFKGISQEEKSKIIQDKINNKDLADMLIKMLSNAESDRPTFSELVDQSDKIMQNLNLKYTDASFIKDEKKFMKHVELRAILDKREISI